MYLRILKKDLKRKKTMNIILLIFITLAAMFIASSVNNILTVTTALDDYFEMAEAPDYWIAISEQSEAERFYAFADENNYDYKNIELLLIEPKDVQVSGEEFDYSNTTYLSTLKNSKVFDSKGEEITKINDGEIYVSANIFNSESNDFYEGAKIVIDYEGTKKEFTLKGYVKDALFGSSMIGMTRFLVSENDYSLFPNENSGITNSISVYTDDSKFHDKFAALELNTIFDSDDSVLGTMYIMDTLIAAIVLIVSICLILVSMIILHFTINFTMSEEFREIGVMKAIGIPNRNIRGLYIVKYLAISIVGTVIGFLLSIPFSTLLLENASKNIIISGEGNLLLNLVCSFGAAAIVVLFCYFCTRKIKKFSPVDAIRNGENGERYKRKGVLRLSKTKLPAVLFMTVNDVLSGLKKYISMLVIFTLGVLLVIIPVNTINTLQSDKLIKWFNMADSDFVISQEILFAPNGHNMETVEKSLNDVKEYLAENNIDADVYREIIFRMTVSYNGRKMTSLAFQGIGGVTTDMYSYIKGTPPQNNNEVAISHYVADTIGAKIGDDVEINTGNETKTYTVTAINQSMNNNGEGIRFYQQENLDYSFTTGCFGIQIKFDDNPSAKVLKERKALLAEEYPDTEVFTAGEYIDSMIGSVAGMLEDVKTLILAVILCINILVAVLMVKSFITKEKSEIAILKAVGFRNSSLTLWQTMRIGMILLIAIIIGTLISEPMSHLLIEPVFRMMGAYSIEFDIKPIEVYLIYPLIVLSVTSLAAFVSSLGLRKIQASEVSNIE